MAYTVNQIAKLAGVTIRTLRHYDRIGLLHPAERTASKYRLYTDEDVERLQQILFFRELDFPLAKIREIMADPGYDRKVALALQIRHLEERAQRYDRLSRMAKETLNHIEGGIMMDRKKMFEGFDYEKIMDHQKQYEDEVKNRWGQTDAYRISNERTSKYSKEDWAAISAAADEYMKELIACFHEKVPHNSPRMMAVCEKARGHISTYFYPCTLEIYSNLGNMYVADERFTEFYDKHAPGLAAYYNDAIQHYCITLA